MSRCLALIASIHAVAAMEPFRHNFGTVGSMMAMHGKYKYLDAQIPPQDIAFIASNYATITTGTGCDVNGTGTAPTIEESVRGIAQRVKMVNPKVPVGMYWRVTEANEMASCSAATPIWNAHPEWQLKDDTGKVISNKGKHMYDFLQPAVQEFFASTILNASAPLMNGQPILDFIYLDYGGYPGQNRTFAPGISMARSIALYDAIGSMISIIVHGMDERGLGQKVIQNALDDIVDAAARPQTGIAGSMFDHFSILQFVNRSTGAFDVDAMDGAFQMMASTYVANQTIQVKGWPGPIIKQRDEYPPTLPQPKSPADFQKIATERFNSELALFLLVARDTDFWAYSWFWGWYDNVPGDPTSTLPSEWFPQAKCTVGTPSGPAKKTGATTWTRTFQKASVTVDLANRMNSKVAFTSC